MRALKQDGSLMRANAHAMALEENYELVGLQAQTAQEERYDRDAAALIGNRAAE
jgi:hypothetical protein